MFRMGQSVICVDARRSSGALRRGAVYTVDVVNGKFLHLAEHRIPHGGWYHWRFRPAPSIAIFQAMLQPKEIVHGEEAEGRR